MSKEFSRRSFLKGAAATAASAALLGITGVSSALSPFKNARAGISPGSAPHRQRLTGG